MVERPTRPTVPSLCKYSGANHLDRLESIILKSELYFPTLIQLNDPADARPRIAASSPEDVVAYLHNVFVANNPGLSKEDYQQAAVEIANGIQSRGMDAALREMTSGLHRMQDTHRVYSLSKRWDNLSLWAKYASDHRGYCLEFSNEGRPFGSAYEVIYDGPVTLDLTDPAQIDAHYIFHKSNDWRCEEEVRIFTLRGSPSLVTFDPKLLTRIILGKDMTKADRTKIREWAQKRSPELVIACAEYDEFEQRLVINA